MLLRDLVVYLSASTDPLDNMSCSVSFTTIRQARACAQLVRATRAANDHGPARGRLASVAAALEGVAAARVIDFAVRRRRWGSGDRERSLGEAVQNAARAVQKALEKK
jgi:hypothetical protein